MFERIITYVRNLVSTMTDRIANKIFNRVAIMDEEARQRRVNRENARMFDQMLFEINFWGNEVPQLMNQIQQHDDDELIYVPRGRRELPPGPLRLREIAFNPESRYDGFMPRTPKRTVGKF